MKKTIYSLGILLLLVLLLAIISNKNFIIENIVNFITQNKENYSLLITINIFYFLSPLPVTPIILANGFIYSSLGFFIIYPIIVIDSLLIFLFFRYIIHLNKFKFLLKKKFFKSKKFLSLKKISEKKFTFFISRYTFPYFIHNICYGLMNISFKKFCYLVILSEIPLTYAFIMLGNSLNDLMYQDFDLFNIFYSESFLLPLTLIIIFMLFINYIKRKF